MDRNKLVADMTALLQDAVEAEEEHEDLKVESSSPLVGDVAVVSSMSLVSYIMDVEANVEDEYGIQVVLVNEQALSRSNSPFRTVETLADYVMELAGELSEAST